MRGGIHAVRTEDPGRKNAGIPFPRREYQLDEYPTEKIPIVSLREADSPRLAGENGEHARVLAESESVLPPIVVHRPTMRVIDGMHRLRAAELRGQYDIEVRFYEGDESDAFVLAVQANIAHGLPLSHADRVAAAARILGSHPQWSDRVVAAATGLAATTVAAIRTRSTEGNIQSNTRVGRDGRARPVSSAAGRRLASELMKDNPGASLREIARASGISPSTVRDVRERLRSGSDPVPTKLRDTGEPKRQAKRGTAASTDESTSEAWGTSLDTASALQILRKDPSLRLNETGRALLRWLADRTIDKEDWERLVENVPAHCADMIAEVARANADSWRELAYQVTGCQRPSA